MMHKTAREQCAEIWDALGVSRRLAGNDAGADRAFEQAERLRGIQEMVALQSKRLTRTVNGQVSVYG